MEAWTEMLNFGTLEPPGNSNCSFTAFGSALRNRSGKATKSGGSVVRRSHGSILLGEKASASSVMVK